MTNIKPKVLYVSINGYLGGAEKFVVDVVSEHHHKKSIDVQVLFFSKGTALDICSKAGITCFLYEEKIRLSRPWSIVKAILWMKKLVLKEKINILHGTMSYAQILCGAVSLITGIKNFWYQHGPVGDFLDTFATLFPYDIVAFNSHYLLDQQDKIIKFRNPKVGSFVVSPGFRDIAVSDEDVLKIRTEHLQKNEQKLFVAAGRITAIKGFHLIIEALAFLKQQNPEILSHIKVLIIGSAQLEKDIAYEESIKLMAEANKLTEHITFIPFQQNINAYYKASDFFVHTTTISESFGLVIGEAMMQKALVIGSNAGGTKEILKHEVNGLSYDSTVVSSATQLKNIIIRVMGPAQKDNLIRLRVKGRESILQNFSFDKTIAILEKHYQDLLN